MSKRKPRNTTKDVKEKPLVYLGIAMAEGSSGMIRNQESRGQQSFVASTTLPTKIQTDKGKKILEKWGIVFGEVIADDPMFQYVTLPQSWEKQSTGHSMWSELVDDKGRKRASIFYKAAFYDRDAFMSLTRRYSHQNDYDRRDKEQVAVTQVTDCGQVIHETEPLTIGADDKNYELSKRSQSLAVAWLDEYYPGWNDPAAYWDRGDQSK